MNAPRQPYDHTREMADANVYRGTLIWVAILLGSTGLVLATIGIMTGNHSLYVHPDIPHSSMFPIHWR